MDMALTNWIGSMDHNDDKHLLKRIRKGDASALSVVFTKYQRPLLAYLINYCSNEDLSKDAAQDAFLLLIKRPPLFLRANTLKAWLFKTARNRLVDLLRRENKLTPHNSMSDDICPQLQPDDTLIQSDDLHRLQHMIDQLPEQYREIVILHHFSELTFKEIAAVIKIPLGTALWRMQKALSILREEYSEGDMYEK